MPSTSTPSASSPLGRGSTFPARRSPWPYIARAWRFPRLELVRLAIPRRVYTRAHLDYVAETIISVYRDRSAIRPLRFTTEPPSLRHFLARFEPLSETI